MRFDVPQIAAAAWPASSFGSSRSGGGGPALEELLQRRVDVEPAPARQRVPLQGAAGAPRRPVDVLSGPRQELRHLLRPQLRPDREQDGGGRAHLRCRKGRPLTLAEVVGGATRVALLAHSFVSAVSARGKVERMPTPGAAMSV